jgi:FkbM family methyltransferase
LRDPKTIAHRRWTRDKMEFLRYDYLLDAQSVCLDVGGYKGEWTEAIWKKFGCQVYVFEPVPAFFESITQRFEGNEKIQVFQFGLSDVENTANIAIDENASSIYRSNHRGIAIHVRDIVEVLDELEIKEVDLIKLNIEGGEYPVLERLIETGWISRIRDIQVQFHDFIEGAAQRRQRLHEDLDQTHKIRWCYPFIWENWTLRAKQGK